MSQKKVLSTPKEFWDEFEPKWKEAKKMMDNFPDTFRLDYSEDRGYFLDVHIKPLEEHLPVEVD